jgi:hypothetical protein
MGIRSSSRDFPNHAKPALALIEDMGFMAYFEPRFPLPEDAPDKRVQVRSEGNLAPSAEVNRYAVAMQNGNQFPPIIVTEDGVVVDGNTRVGAKRKRQETFIEALVLDVKNDSAHAPALKVLGAAFNVRNGRSIDKAEIRKAVQGLGVKYDHNAETVARRLGITASLVKSYFAEDRAINRMTSLGLTFPLIVAYLRPLGAASASLHDEPFKALAELCRDSGLATKDFGLLIKRVKSASSDEAALDIIRSERDLRKEQIRRYRFTGKKAKPALDAQFRQSMGLVLNNSDRIKEFVDANPYTSQARLAMIDEFLGLVRAIREEQAKQAAFDKKNKAAA